MATLADSFLQEPSNALLWGRFSRGARWLRLVQFPALTMGPEFATDARVSTYLHAIVPNLVRTCMREITSVNSSPVLESCPQDAPGGILFSRKIKPQSELFQYDPGILLVRDDRFITIYLPHLDDSNANSSTASQS